MGGILSNCWRCLTGDQRECKIVLLGLDNAGKTTALYRFKLQQAVKTTPTVGFNVEEVKWGNLTFLMWDVGGQDRVRHLWSHYFSETKAVIFMVDSADIDRVAAAKQELHKVLDSAELPGDTVVLVLANKQDLPFAMGIEKMSDELGLHLIKESRRWHIQGSNAISGEGLHEGLNWLAGNIR